MYGNRLDDPAHLGGITENYLAGLLSVHFGGPVSVTAWQLATDTSWQSWVGRSAAELVAITMSISIAGRPPQDMAVIVKTTPSMREAMFYRMLAPLLGRHVPEAYRVVIRGDSGPHWLFLEYIPCMVLGPLWEGAEFNKGIEGLVAIQAPFWPEIDMLRSQPWLPAVTREVLMRQFDQDLSWLKRASLEPSITDHTRRDVAGVLALIERSVVRITTLEEAIARQPWTLIHGDYHLANIGTRDRTPDAIPVVTDWADYGVGAPQFDLGYFLDRVQGLTREKPSHDHLVSEYFMQSKAAGAPLQSEDEFNMGLAAAHFFQDVPSIAYLLLNRESEDTWRVGIFHSVGEEVSFRLDRVRRLLSGE